MMHWGLLAPSLSTARAGSVLQDAPGDIESEFPVDVSRAGKSPRDGDRNLSPREFDLLMRDMGIDDDAPGSASGTESHLFPQPTSIDKDNLRAVFAPELQHLEVVMRQLLDELHDKLISSLRTSQEATASGPHKVPSSSLDGHRSSSRASDVTSCKRDDPGTDYDNSSPLDNPSHRHWITNNHHEAHVELPALSRAPTPKLTEKQKAKRSASWSLQPNSSARSVLSKLHDKEGKSHHAVMQFVEWLESFKEPEHTSCLAKLITSKYFESFCLAVIVMHGMLSALRLNEEVANMYNGEDDGFLVQGGVSEVVELTFLVFYIAELLLKLGVRKVYFFICDGWKWNVMDLFLVLFSSVDILMTYIGTASSSNIMFLRQGRLLKLVRALRALRALRFLTELRQMMLALINSVATLTWCIVLIIFIQYIFAMLFVQGFAEYLERTGSPDGDDDMRQRQRIFDNFGSVGKAIISLFMAVTGGQDWVFFYRLIELTGWWRATFFLFYICFYYVAAVNIITGTFVDKAFKLAQPDLEQMMMEKVKGQQDDARALQEVFIAANKDHDAKLSWEEAKELVDGPWQHILQARGIDADDAETFFTLLTRHQEDDEGVDVETFVNGCLHMKGFATSIDVSTLEYKVDVFHDEVRGALHYLVHMAKASEERFAGLEGGLQMERSRRRASTSS